MSRARLRAATRRLVFAAGSAGLVLFILWLALPRLLGLAAEHWLSVPGVSSLRVDIARIGTGKTHLREISGIYRSASGHRIRIVLRDIAVAYSPLRRQIERLDIAHGELDLFPRSTGQASPWPRLEWPHLPWSEARIHALRASLHRPGRPPLQLRGSLDLKQEKASARTTLRAAFENGDLLWIDAMPGDALILNAGWEPVNAPAARARLTLAALPGGQPALLEVQAPLPALEQLARNLGMLLPPGAAHGNVTLKASAALGETTGELLALDTEVEFSNARLERIPEGSPVGKTRPPHALTVDGRMRFNWQPASALLELHPGFRWQARLDAASLQASGQLARAFALRMNGGVVLGDDAFPFSLSSPRWGLWEGALQRVESRGDGGLNNWHEAILQLHLKGQTGHWQPSAQSTMSVHNAHASGNATLHWSGTSGVHARISLQSSIDRLAWANATPFAIARSDWKINAEANAKSVSDFWSTLVLRGEASTPQLKIQPGSGLPLTLGPSHLSLEQFRPGQPNGPRGELQLAAEKIRFGTWPLPDMQARIRLISNVVHAEGAARLQGAELLRFAGKHALARGCGKASLNMQQGLQELGNRLQPRPPALTPLDLKAGEANARFALDWCTQPFPRFDARGKLEISNAALGWDQAQIEALQLKLQLDGLQPAQGRIQLSAQRGKLATGTELTALDIDLALAEQALQVNALHLDLLGGSLRSVPATLPWPLQEKTLALEVHEIDLGQLLDLFRLHGLSGSGTIAGVLPLAWRDGGMEIHDGRLDSLGPGTLKYAPAVPALDNPGLQALRNLHYRRLGIRLWYGANGTYRTESTLEGHNPDFYDGYPVRFGLNINGVLPGLFRAALFSGDFNRHILEQLQSGKLE